MRASLGSGAGDDAPLTKGDRGHLERPSHVSGGQPTRHHFGRESESATGRHHRQLTTLSRTQNYKRKPISMYNPHKAPLLDHYR